MQWGRKRPYSCCLIRPFFKLFFRPLFRCLCRVPANVPADVHSLVLHRLLVLAFVNTCVSFWETILPNMQIYSRSSNTHELTKRCTSSDVVPCACIFLEACRPNYEIPINLTHDRAKHGTCVLRVRGSREHNPNALRFYCVDRMRFEIEPYKKERTAQYFVRVCTFREAAEST